MFIAQCLAGQCAGRYSDIWFAHSNDSSCYLPQIHCIAIAVNTMYSQSEGGMKKLKEIWPSIAAMARDVEAKAGAPLPYVTAQKWIARGNIPPIWRQWVIAAAADRGHTITDEDCRA